MPVCLDSGVRFSWPTFSLNNLFWPHCLLTSLAWKPVPANIDWEPEPVLGNLAPVPENFAWQPVLGNLAWDPVPGDLAWELWECGLELLRPALKPLLWLKTPSLRCLEKESVKTHPEATTHFRPIARFGGQVARRKPHSLTHWICFRTPHVCW